QNDSLGRLISTRRQDNTLVAAYGTNPVTLAQYAYDGDNNKVLFTDADGNHTQYVYDGGNRMIQEIDGLGSPVAATTTYAYDKIGNVIWIKDGRAHGAPTYAFFPQDPRHLAPPTFDTYFTYDALYRKLTQTDGDGDATSYTYDGNGNVKSM